MMGILIVLLAVFILLKNKLDKTMGSNPAPATNYLKIFMNHCMVINIFKNITVGLEFVHGKKYILIITLYKNMNFIFFL